MRTQPDPRGGAVGEKRPMAVGDLGGQAIRVKPWSSWSLEKCILDFLIVCNSPIRNTRRVRTSSH